MRHITRQMRIVVLALLACAGAVHSVAANQLDWDTGRGRVNADIQGLELPDLLGKIARTTGWQIYVEPGTERVVSAKFTERTTGEALRLLLGDISFALLPQPAGPKKLLVFKTAVSQATAQIESEIDTAIPIPNELIVRVKPGTDIDALAKELGAEVVGRNTELNVYRLRFADQEAADRARELLQDREEVTAVGSNFHVDRSPKQAPLTSPPPDSGVPKMKARTDSAQVVIGLIDTAIQTTGTDLDQWVLPGLSVTGAPGEGGDSPTHGTAMYQTMLRSIAQAAGDAGANVRILPVDVYGNNAMTTTYDVANGIAQAVNNGATIVNLSLGSEGDSGYLRAVIQAAYNQGVVFIGAAGNEPVSNPTFPAAYPEVLSVTSSDWQGGLANYANTGDWVDTIAPGTTRLFYDGRVWQTSGTSVSAAWLSGWLSVQPSPREALPNARTQFAR